MRFSTVAVVAAAVAPAAVSAAAGQAGFALGTKNADGTCKYTDDYKKDFDAIKSGSGSTIVRGYSASDCNFAQQILPAAKDSGFKVVLGIWPDTDASYAADKGAVVQYASQYKDQVYAITVGSETLYRGNFTGKTLADKINDVKAAVPGVKVGTADSWNKWADGTGDDAISSCDIVLVNAFGFWQAQEINNATHTYFDDIMQAFAHIQEKSGSTSSPELWNGETGWPTDGGSNYGAAIAGTQNAKKFYQEGFCGLIEWGVNAFYFEAFDEPWKPDSIGDDGKPADEKHWGAMGSDRSTKFSLQCSPFGSS